VGEIKKKEVKILEKNRGMENQKGKIRHREKIPQCCYNCALKCTRKLEIGKN
jgi:hypothetical protein